MQTKTDDAQSVTTGADSPSDRLLDAVLLPLMRLLTAGGFSHGDILGSFERSLPDSQRVTSGVPSINLGLQLRDCMEVMCIWRRDPRYLSIDGAPSSLKIRGDGVSFAGLCATAASRTEADLLLETLLAFDAVRIVDGDRVEATTPTFIVGARRSGEMLALDGILKQLAGFLRTIEHNVSARDRPNWRPRFERACTVTIANELVPIFEQTVSVRGQEFIDGLDEWLERHRGHSSPTGTYVEVGTGAYFVELGVSGRPRETNK